AGKEPRTLAIEAKLKEPISRNVDKQPLSEVITFLQNYSGLNIVPDPKGLAEEGLSSSSPVSLQVNNVSMKTALKLMLRPLGLTYKVEDEVILITSPQATVAETITQTYYVGALMMPPNKPAQNMLPHNVMNPEPKGELSGQPNLPTMPGSAGNDPRSAQATGGIGTSVGERQMVDLSPLIQLIA